MVCVFEFEAYWIHFLPSFCLHLLSIYTRAQAGDFSARPRLTLVTGGAA
jgi:hypothetical protein